jgi:hypothetical protein
MRTLLVMVALATAGGCASINRSGGASGAAVVSGETKSPAAEAGANTDSIATSGSNPSDPTAVPSR